MDDDQWMDIDDAELARLMDGPTGASGGLRSSPQHEGFDNSTGNDWIYPSNLPLRAYQKNIIQAALYKNTLVVLPTGLGKTFIAAVIMYNLYRWYPKGKVIFMAPTRPLVAQQIEACGRLMPFNAADTVELTGKLQRPKRMEMWRTKRVFFVTPQVLQSDITSSPEEFPFKQVKLLVFDEAHKATGRYAYTEVAQSILARNLYFRVLALSATPGRTTETVATVIRNLFISHLEVRFDNSIDVAPYVHKRHMRTVVVPFGEKIRRIREELLSIIDPYVRQLMDAEVLSGSLASINRNFLLYEQKRFRERSLRQRHSEAAAVATNFSICISMYHSLELLERHGLRVFLNIFEADEEGRGKFTLAMDRRLADLVERVRSEVGANPFEVSAHAMTNGRMPEMPADLDFGHPKFEEARKVLLEHFQAHPESRAIVFSEYRESVMLIHRLLLQHSPLLRPRCFVGQGGTSGSLRALSQKQQMQIMSDFRSGKSNILIATSIGEEGIDVGEVELIVCFDISTSNPTRFVQRIGRTGRKKNGNVVMLVTEGKEQAQLQDVLKNKDHTVRQLLGSSVIRGSLYRQSPRLVPSELNPTCVHTFIEPVEPVVKDSPAAPKGKKKKEKEREEKTSKAIKGSQDLRKFFKKSSASKTVETFSQIGTQTQKAYEEDSKAYDINVCDLITGKKDDVKETAGEPKHLKKIERLLRSTQSLVSRPERNEDLMTQLRSKQLSRDSKLLLLRMRVDFVRETRDQMQTLEALAGGEGADDEVQLMTEEEQAVRDSYKLVETICGSRQELQELIDDAEFEMYKKSLALRSDPDESDAVATNALNMSDAAFMSCVDAIFAKCDNLGFCGDNYEYIQSELKKTKRYELALQGGDMTLEESALYSTMAESAYEEEPSVDEFSMMEAIQDSKYASQWEDFAENRAMDSKSTPLQAPGDRSLRRPLDKDKVKSSTFLENLMEDDDDIYFMEDPVYPVDEAQPKKDTKSSNGTDTTLNTSQSVEVDGTRIATMLRSLQEALSPATRKQKKNEGAKLEEISHLSKENNQKSFEDVKESCQVKQEKLEHPSVESFKGNDENEAYLGETEVFLKPEMLRDVPKIKLESPEPHAVLDRAIKYERTPSPQPVSTQPSSSSTEKMLSELDLDMDAFLEPFPEEELVLPETEVNPKVDLVVPETEVYQKVEFVVPETEVNPKESEKENRHKSVALHANSPDLFATDESPRSPKKITLAAKLAAKKAANLMRTPTKVASPLTTKASGKSPSIFDMYSKKRGQQPKSPLVERRRNQMNIAEDTDGDASVVVMPAKRQSSKRKLIESSDEEEEQQKEASVVELSDDDDDETDDEEQVIATTVKKGPSNRYHPANKRRRLLNSFIEQEAGVSGSEGSEDEAEHTIGQYLCDSVVVDGSGSSPDTDASATDLHAIYLQSVRSPQGVRRGAFKIPAPRTFNDISMVYSQPAPMESSQYEHDSFVVSETEPSRAQHDESLCPLERAERILKERRRAKRQLAQVGTIEKRKKRRIVRMHDSSDEDE